MFKFRVSFGINIQGCGIFQSLIVQPDDFGLCRFPHARFHIYIPDCLNLKTLSIFGVNGHKQCGIQSFAQSRIRVGPGQQPTLFVVDYVSAYCFAENALVSESVEVIVSNLECQSQ